MCAFEIVQDQLIVLHMGPSRLVHVDDFLYVVQLVGINLNACLIGNELITRQALGTVEAISVDGTEVYIIDAVGAEQVRPRWAGYTSLGINLETAEGLGLNKAKTEQPDGAMDK